MGEFGAHLHWSLLMAALIILLIGFIDDTRSLSPRVKLLGQALAVLTLYLGGIRIEAIERSRLERRSGVSAVSIGA